MKKRKYDGEWAEAKRLCRLSADDVRKARELGLSPRALIKNRPSSQQQWKAPVHIWVREMYRQRQEKTRSRPALPPSPERPGEAVGAEWARPASEVDDEWASGTWDHPISPADEVEDENRRARNRQAGFRAAADALANVFARLPWVERIALFGSVAWPLRKEVPRSRRLRRAGKAVDHECKDLDLAVWVNDLSTLDHMRKEQSRTVNDLFESFGIGLAHHQVDVFLMEMDTDRYLGRLCHFGACPKGKPECRVPGCGASPFLRQVEGFRLDPRALDTDRIVLLFDRPKGIAPPLLRIEDVPTGDAPF